MGLTKEQVIEIAERYLIEHPEIPAEVLDASDTGQGQWWALLRYYSGGRGILPISPEGEVIKTQTGFELFKNHADNPPQTKGH